MFFGFEIQHREAILPASVSAQRSANVAGGLAAPTRELVVDSSSWGSRSGWRNLHMLRYSSREFRRGKLIDESTWSDIESVDR